ncbi:MAG: ribonuclease E/G [Clostridium sp.]
MRKIFIERQQSLLKVAIKENNILKECFVEEETMSPKVGEIYKGVVKNIVPAMKCAFVDIGFEKNGYMSVEGKKKDNGLKKGQEVMVEILKEDVGKKGPKVSPNISLPGTYVVLTKEHNELQISKRIASDEFKSLVESQISKPEDIGIVIRTKAEGVDFQIIKNEIEELINMYEEIRRQFTYSAKVGPLYKDNGILSRIIRNYTEGGAEIIVDEEEDFNYFKKIISEKKLDNIYVTFYQEPLSIFDYYGIEKEILTLRHNKINLPGGGNIVVEKTEAMTVVDVNTAKNIKLFKDEGADLITNKEAAVEIVKQIRLRNLGGIILVDFVDMKSSEEKKQVMDILKKEFFDDKHNPKVYPFTELNLIQITRKKYGKSICDFVFEECKVCHGSGEKVSLNYLSSIIKGKIKRILEEQQVKNIYIELPRIYEEEVKEDVLNFAIKLGAADCDLYVKFEEHNYNFKVEPIIFHSQFENLKNLQIFSSNLKRM